MTREEAAKMTPKEAVDRFLRWADGDEHAWDGVPVITQFVPIKDVMELQDGDWITYMDGSVEFIPRW